MKRVVILFLVFFLGVSTAFPAKVSTLYQGVLPVATQSATQRDRLATEALAQVFIKVSGNDDILNNPAIKAHLSSANSLVDEYSYSRAPSIPGNAMPWLLQLDFGVDAINKILREAGAPIWGQNRPLMAVWLDYEVPGHAPEIIGADSGSNITLLLKQNTDRRGVPVVFPALDVQDLAQVTVNDVASMNFFKLINGSARYSSDAVLAGRIQATANGYITQWKLALGNDQWGWTITAKTLPDVMAEIANHVAGTLAGRYATVISNTVQSEFTLKIQGIAAADDFVQVSNYLRHLTPVSDVQLLEIDGTNMVVKISLRGTRESFEKALSVGKKLTPVANTNPSLLAYQWNNI